MLYADRNEAVHRTGRALTTREECQVIVMDQADNEIVG